MHLLHEEFFKFSVGNECTRGCFSDANLPSTDAKLHLVKYSIGILK